MRAYLGPIFDVLNLYEQAPVVCKVKVWRIEEGPQITLRPNGGDETGYLMKTKIATLFMLRSYKGDLPKQIRLLFPYDSATGVGYAWTTIDTNQVAVAFLKPEKDYYRFWYEIYESYLPVALEGTPKSTNSLATMKNDIISSFSAPIAISGPCLEQLSDNPWPEALPAFKTISSEAAPEKFALALWGRLAAGDWTAFDESKTLFDKHDDWPKSQWIEKARGGCAYLYFSKSSSPSALAILQEIADGQRPWIDKNLQRLVKVEWLAKGKPGRR